MSSESIATSALSAYGTEIDVIANNAANVGTPGFRASNVGFKSVAAPTNTITPGGHGISVATISAISTQAALAPTGQPTDLTLNNNSYFVLQATGGDVYTRDANFSIDANGTLVDTTTGLPVLGYSAGGALQPIEVPTGESAGAIGTGFGPTIGPTNEPFFDASVAGNLNQAVYQQAAAGGPTSSIATTATIYDSLGNQHEITLTFTSVPPSAGGVNPATQTVDDPNGTPHSVGTEWLWTASNQNPSDPMTLGPTSGYGFFDPSGAFINTSSDPTGQTNTYAGGPVNIAGAHGNIVGVPNWGLGNNAQPAAIALDLSQMTSIAGTSTPTMTTQNGAAPGTLTSVNVDHNGTVTGSFSNGTQQTLGSLAVAQFPNADGLQPLGDTLFAATPASGDPQVGVVQNDSIQSGYLNASNVNLSDEFVKLIESKGAFDANAASARWGEQTITTTLNLT
jgi:flagellar hook protein FlgE